MFLDILLVLEMHHSALFEIKLTQVRVVPSVAPAEQKIAKVCWGFASSIPTVKVKIQLDL